MKTWQEALEILLIEIGMSVSELARRTNNGSASLSRFLGGANSRIGTLDEWLEVCEEHHEGSIRMFHLIRLGEAMYKKKKSVKEHVAEMDNLQMAEYLSEISNRLRADEEKLVKQLKTKTVNLKG